MAAPTPVPTPAEVEGLRRLARGLLGRGDLAEDAVQDAWVIARERGGPRTTAWLGGIVRNRARQILRAEGRRRRREERAAGGRPVPEPLDHVAAIERQRIVLEELERLPEPLRLTLWLRFFAGRSAVEIARERGIPSATVRTHVHRGIALLRERMDRRHGGRRSAWLPALAPFAFPPDGRACGPSPSRVTFAGGGPGPGLALVLVVTLLPVALLAVGGGPSSERLPAREVGREGPGTPGLRSRGVADRGAEIRRVEAARIRARVGLYDGEPGGGAEVYAVPKEKEPGESVRPAVHETVPESGQIALVLVDPAASWIVVVPPPGAGASRLVLDGAAVAAQDGDATWVLPRGRRVEVRVSDPAGEAIAGARVEVLAEDPQLAVPWPGPREPLLGLDRVTALGEGRHEVRLADDRPRWIRVHAPRRTSLERLLGAGDVFLEAALEPSAKVWVRLGATDALPEGATATLEPVSCGPWARRMAGRRESDGFVFEDGVGPGLVRLRVQVPGHLPWTSELLVRHSGECVETQATLEPCGPEGSLLLTGLGARAPEPTGITDGRGTVLVRRLERGNDSWEIRQATVRADGSLLLERLVPGAVRLLVVDGRGPRVAFVREALVPVGERATIALDPAEAAWFAMRSADGGGPFVGATVLLAGGDEVPLYRFGAAGTLLHDGAYVPPVGVRVGPYPIAERLPSLLLREAGGATRRLALEAPLEILPSGATR